MTLTQDPIALPLCYHFANRDILLDPVLFEPQTFQIQNPHLNLIAIVSNLVTQVVSCKL